MEFILWIVFSAAVAVWADSKGHDAIGWGLISLIISPLLGAIVLFIVSLKDQEKIEAKKIADQEAAKLEERRLQSEVEAEVNRTTIRASDFSAEIEKYFGLKENGLLSDLEFADRKKNLVDALATKKPRESATDFLSTLIPLVKRSALTSEEISEIKKYIF